MIAAAARAALLGLSTGLFCMASCAPVFVPLMLAEERGTAARRLLPFLQFSLGRFIAYTAVGLVAGILGGGIARMPRGAAGASFAGLGLLMLLYGLVRGFPQWRPCRAAAPALERARAPFLLGLLLGVNLCPPFIVALSDVLVSGTAAYGIAFFSVFFLVTTLFLLPFLFLGRLAKVEAIRTVARLAAAIVGAVYLYMGLGILLA
jgi:sulfite exporter TauE/SafE